MTAPVERTEKLHSLKDKMREMEVLFEEIETALRVSDLLCNCDLVHAS